MTEKIKVKCKKKKHIHVLHALQTHMCFIMWTALVDVSDVYCNKC